MLNLRAPLLVLCLVSVSAASSAPKAKAGGKAGAAAAIPAPPCPLQGSLEMADGAYSSQPGVSYQLHDFAAKIRSGSHRSPFCFQRTTYIEKGQVTISSESLTVMFNRKIRSSDSKLKDVKLELGDKTAKISGKMKKIIDVPFSIEGPVSTDGQSLQLKAKDIHAAGLPMKGLMDTLGKTLASLLGSAQPDGISAQGDVLLFKPEKLAHIRGHLASAVATPKGLVIMFDQAQPGPKAKLEPKGVGTSTPGARPGTRLH